ncbi:N-acetyltransferase [Chryseobacterium sp. RG1]|uniref:N-acetyltransferase n=1 Tax=Chryseobacterium tagetis TaxID=2801334 RepID=A0ABS8A4Z5_9FLAO|nr:N-acetyltransferase [Chryseobacterium tagetis]MCA6067786.1 N-acetyltransferase [Chryseobacterium tagetis]
MKTQILLNNFFQGEIKLIIDEVTVGYMEITVVESRITVYKTVAITEDNEKNAEYSSILFDSLISYARENTMKIIPHCAYTVACFKNNLYLYKDVLLSL